MPVATFDGSLAYDRAVEMTTLKTLHVVFLVELHTGRILIGGVSDGAANVAWCAQIVRNLSEARERRDEPIVLHP
jgi:hypothetical protein